MKKIFLLLIVWASLVGTVNLSAQTKRAFLVGISDYDNPRQDPDRWLNISGANDVHLLTPLLEKQGFNVSSLVDENATKANILKGLKTIIKSSKKGDIVYLHFSCHGQPVEDKNGDETDGWDEAIIPYDAKMTYEKGSYEGKNHLLDDEMEIYFDRLRKAIGDKGMLYVVMDACHSGTASRGDDEHVRGTNEGFSPSGKRYVANREQSTNDYFNVETQKGQSPVIFLEACRSYQKNKEVRDRSSNVWYGSLSYYIHQALTQGSVIGKDSNWIQIVKSAMERDPKLRKQNMVIEASH